MQVGCVASLANNVLVKAMGCSSRLPTQFHAENTSQPKPSTDPLGYGCPVNSLLGVVSRIIPLWELSRVRMLTLILNGLFDSLA